MTVGRTIATRRTIHWWWAQDGWHFNFFVEQAYHMVPLVRFRCRSCQSFVDRYFDRSRWLIVTHTISSTARINQTMVKLIWKKSNYKWHPSYVSPSIHPLHRQFLHSDYRRGNAYPWLPRIQRSCTRILLEQIIESIKVFKHGDTSQRCGHDGEHYNTKKALAIEQTIEPSQAR